MNYNITNKIINNMNNLKEKLVINKSKNIINSIIEDCYENEDILNKSYNDITFKILDNIENIDVSKYKFPKKKFDCILSGGGLKGYYLFGAIIILRKMIDNNQIEIRNFICVSVGAMAAVFLLSGISIHKMRNIYEFAKQNNKYDLNKLTLKILNELLPDNIHELCNNKLKIIVSKLELKNMKEEVITKFKSKEHLLNIIHATSCIPYFTSKNMRGVKIGNNTYYDGAFTNNLPIINDNDMSQLVFHTINVDYRYKNTFNLNDKYPELLILKGVIEMETFLKKVSKKNKKIENIPIEWILPHNKVNITLFDNAIYYILIIFGYIISYMNHIYDYLKNIY